MLAGEGGQHGWASLILSIFVSVWLVRWSKRACRVGKQQPALASATVLRSLGEALPPDRQPRAGRDGRSQVEEISGAHRDWLVQRCRGNDFTLRGLVAELAERGLAVDYRSVWEFVHAEKLTPKKRR